MIICHISDTHGAKTHSRLNIPECDVLIHSGDIGGRTNNLELAEFLIWFEEQPAKKKIWIAGNHDLILDKEWVQNQKDKNVITGIIAEQQYREGNSLIDMYNIIYLNNSSYVYDGIKFYGSPYTPSFHRQHWAFNADRGEEIKQYWDMIPVDVDVLITHGAPYGILDKTVKGENKGCEELKVIVDKIRPKLFLCGHIHEAYGYQFEGDSLFVNASILDANYIMKNKPFIIELDNVTKKAINIS